MEGGWHELLVVCLYQEFDLVTSYAEEVDSVLGY